MLCYERENLPRIDLLMVFRPVEPSPVPITDADDWVILRFGCRGRRFLFCKTVANVAIDKKETFK